MALVDVEANDNSSQKRPIAFVAYKREWTFALLKRLHVMQVNAEQKQATTALVGGNTCTRSQIQNSDAQCVSDY
ncbi:hypothetical protein O5D80_007620 [Batrachochytrium dendrobatidis]|nr:hypothetical protein O5D80_007620 [Batrachochytrium dendrobatidis]